jgi:hypothetical protein
MNRQSLSSRTTGFQKLYVQYEQDKHSTVAYLLNFQGKTVTSLVPRRRSCILEMQLHPEWKRYLVMQLKNSRCFRMKFFCWILANLLESEGSFRFLIRMVVSTVINSANGGGGVWLVGVFSYILVCPTDLF